MNASRCTGPVNRRELLRVGALTLGGLGISDVLAGRAAAGHKSLDTSVILLYLNGGPTHLETYDLKPEAPTTHRSILNSIPTCTPGMDICELFPRQAAVADRFSLVRSMNHDVGIHSDGGITVLTGKRPSVLDPLSQSKSEHPDLGSVASRVRGLGEDPIPQYVGIPSAMGMTRPVYLGVRHGAFAAGNPAVKNYRPPLNVQMGKNVRGLDDRRKLLSQLDTLRRDLDLRGNMQGADEFHNLAFELLTSQRTAQAFDLSQEKDDLRARYGRNLWGQGCLLARRLAEAGTAVVTVQINTPETGQQFTNWDDHIMNAGRPGHFGQYLKVRLPYLDQALSALIEDVFQKSLDRRILVVAMGEFGRTPRLSSNSTGVGRNHWPQAYTALVSGGGLKMGQVVGATSSLGEFPTEAPYGPQDLLAMVYRHLGIDHSQAFVDFAGRPISILSKARPISELL